MRALVVGGILFSLVGMGTAPAAGLCDDVKAVLAASVQLKDVATQPISDDSWGAKLVVTGFARCEVSKLKSGKLSFSCTKPMSRSKEGAKRDYDSVQKAVSACLPTPAWSYTIQAGSFDWFMFHNLVTGQSGNLSIDKNFDAVTTGDIVKIVDVWSVTLTIYEKSK